MKLTSIRSRILTGIGLLQLSVASIAVFLVIDYLQRESLSAFDANLASRATSLLALVEAPENDASSLTLRRDVLVLPPTDRYRLSDDRNHIVADTPDWRLPDRLPQGKRATVNFSSNGISYRALMIRQVPVVDPEEEERPASEHISLVYGVATTDMDAHLQRVAASAGLGFVAMLGFSLAATFWIVRLGLRPLDALAVQAARIDADHWGFEIPATASELWEVRSLSRALSHLVSRLQAAFQRERQMFGDAAHEMKTAVSIVKSTLQLALQVRRPSEEYRKRLVRALDDTERLQQFVIRMLQLAGIETSPHVQHARTHAEATIRAVIEQFASLAETHRVTIDVKRCDLHCLDVPEQDFQLLAANLIENAIQHSHPDTRIEITILKRNDTSELTVRNYGPGIPAEALPHIFERFFRTDQSRSRASGGFGLGLAIVHAVTVKYGGRVTVHSVVQRETTFTVSLPACDLVPKERGLLAY